MENAKKTTPLESHAALQKLIYSALLLALAYVLPYFTGQIQTIGQMLCPMHLPVLLCGFLCGWQWGLVIGFTAPILRSLTNPMPPMYPTALGMAFELATYGLIAGLDPQSTFGLAAFWSGAITTAIPGIIVQIVLIPAIVYALRRAGLDPNGR